MSRPEREVLVAGVGMIPFTKPGQGASYDEMGNAAARAAMADAGKAFDIEQQS